MTRPRILVLLTLMTLSWAAAVQAESPSNLAGITLGDAAIRYQGRIRTSPAVPVGGAPWLHRLAIVPDKYFSGGYVLVGTCAAPGRVARIKARYRDDGLEFFRKVSGEMLTRYGDPTEYKGELDGRVMGNKWGFSDAWVRPVSLILQRVEGEDPETGGGNTIKLTNWGLLEAERICWEERHAPAVAKPAPKGGKSGQDNGYLPR